MRVKAIQTCFVGSYHDAGEEFEYDGPKNENLQPLDGAKWPSPAKKEATAIEVEPKK